MSTDYVPYKVHLTVTMEPGWYSRYHQYDGLVEVTLTPGGGLPPLGDVARRLAQGVESLSGGEPIEGLEAGILKRLRDEAFESLPRELVRLSGCKVKLECAQELVRTQVRAQVANNDLWILTATPAEEAQTIEEMTAALTRMSHALAAGGRVGSAASVAGDVKFLRERARRLEGLRTNKTMIVSFTGPNTLRVRFRSAIAPTKHEYDLQPVTRVVTAIVLVRRTWDCSGAECSLAVDRPHLGDADKWRAAKRVEADRSEKFYEADLDAHKAALEGIEVNDKKRTVSIRGIELDNRQVSEVFGFVPDSEEFLRPNEIDIERWGEQIKKLTKALPKTSEQAPALARDLEKYSSWQVAKAGRDRAIEGVDRQRAWRFSPRECTYDVCANFVPSLRFVNGNPKPSRSWCMFGRTRPIERHAVCSEKGRRTSIPMWYGDSRKPLRINQVNGFYSIDVLRVTQAYTVLDKARNALVKAKKGVETATAREATAKKAIEAATKARDDAQAAFHRLCCAGQGESEPCREAKQRLEKAQKALDEAAVTHGRAKKVLEGAKAAHAAATTALEQAKNAYTVEKKSALRSAVVSLGYSISGPRNVVRRSNRQVQVDEADIFLRVVGLNQGTQAGAQGPARARRFRRLGSGDQEGALALDDVDLTGIAMFDDKGKLRLGNLRVLVEVVLSTKTGPDLDRHRDGGLQSRVSEAVLEPVLKVTPSAAAKKSEDSSIKLSLKDVTLKLATDSAETSKPTGGQE